MKLWKFSWVDRVMNAEVTRSIGKEKKFALTKIE